MDDRILQFLDGKRKEVVAAVIAEGSQHKAATKLGMVQSTVNFHVRRAKDEAARRGWCPEYDRVHAVPMSEFVSGVSTNYDADGNVIQQWVKTKASTSRIAEQLEAFAEGLCSNMPSRHIPTKPLSLDYQEDIATHIKIGDQHLGMLAWEEETLVEDYDLDKSTKDIVGGIHYLIECSKPCNRFVIVNVGDFMHINDRSNVTPASRHVLDVDTRYAKIARRAAHILRTAIEMALQKHKNVEVINARGNHDPDGAIALDMVLEAYYIDEPRVQVHCNTAKWIPWVFGKTVVLVNHGEVKPARQYEHVTSVFREIIGKCDHLYIDNGHLHHQIKHEIGAAKIEVWNPLTAPDAYHADNCYGASRSITSVCYHRKYGEVSRTPCDLRMIRDMYA